MRCRTECLARSACPVRGRPCRSLWRTRANHSALRRPRTLETGAKQTERRQCPPSAPLSLTERLARPSTQRMREQRALRVGASRDLFVTSHAFARLSSFALPRPAAIDGATLASGLQTSRPYPRSLVRVHPLEI